MNEPSLLQRIKLIPKRTSTKELFLSILVVYGALWAILEPISFYFEGFKGAKNDWLGYVLLLIATLIITIIRELPQNKITLAIGQQKVIIKFGNLFAHQGNKVIPVSKFMHETAVFETSLQNLLIKKFTDGSKGVAKGLEDYVHKINKATQNLRGTPVERNPDIKEMYYPLGSTTKIEHDGNQYLLFALTETENPKFITNNNCNVYKMLSALDQLWKYIQRNMKDQTISIPLIGGGIAGIQLPPMQLLEFNLISLSDTMSKQNSPITTKAIELIIYTPVYYEQVDLKAIKKIWTKHLNPK